MVLRCCRNSTGGQGPARILAPFPSARAERLGTGSRALGREKALPGQPLPGSCLPQSHLEPTWCSMPSLSCWYNFFISPLTQEMEVGVCAEGLGGGTEPQALGRAFQPLSSRHICFICFGLHSRPPPCPASPPYLGDTHTHTCRTNEIRVWQALWFLWNLESLSLRSFFFTLFFWLGSTA